MVKNIIIIVLLVGNVFWMLFGYVQIQETEKQKNETELIKIEAIKQSELAEKMRILAIEKGKEISTQKELLKSNN